MSRESYYTVSAPVITTTEEALSTYVVQIEVTLSRLVAFEYVFVNISSFHTTSNTQ